MTFAPEDRRDLMRWTLSAVIVLCAHASVAAAMVQWREVEEPADPVAAIVVDLAPMPVAPSETLSEIPPGPEQVQAEATPEKVVEKVEEKFVEKLDEVPNPEVVLTPKPPEKQPDPPKEQQTPAPATTAPQLTPFALAAVAAAPLQGKFTPKNSNAIPSWKSTVVGLLERNKRYPAAAQARGETGVTQLAFVLDRQGRVTSSQIVKSSGSTALDQESLDLVRRSQPFPPPPDELAGTAINLSVPIRFNIR